MNKKTHEYLQKLKKVTDEILDEAKARDDIKGAINWADLRCIEARYVMTDDGSEHFEVVISEADPHQHDLYVFVFTKLQKRRYYPTYPVFEW